MGSKEVAASCRDYFPALQNIITRSSPFQTSRSLSRAESESISFNKLVYGITNINFMDCTYMKLSNQKTAISTPEDDESLYSAVIWER